MAFIKEIQTPDNTKHQIKNTIIPVKGTQTASTGSWTGNIDLPSLYDGLTIAYFLPWAGSGNATLKLTLSDGTQTAAIPCYISSSRLTTHYAKGTNIIMTYWSAGSISIDGTATTDNRWIAHADYNTNTDTKVTQGNTVTTNWRHIILGNLDWSETEPSTDNTTGQVYRNNNIKIAPAYGRLFLKGSSPQQYMIDTNFDLTASDNGVSSETWRALRFLDKNSNNIGLFISAVSSSKTMLLLRTYNKNTGGTESYDAYLGVSVSNTGETSYQISNATAFKTALSLNNVTNNKQIKGLASGTTSGHVVTWGSDGYTVADSDKTLEKSVPSDAVFTDENVKQTNTAITSTSNYRILFSKSANDTTTTEGVRKCAALLFKPSTGTLTLGSASISGALRIYYYDGSALSTYGDIKQMYSGFNPTHYLPPISTSSGKSYLLNQESLIAGKGININVESGNVYPTINSDIYLGRTHVSNFFDYTGKNDDLTRSNCIFFKIFYKDSNNCNYGCLTIPSNSALFPTLSTEEQSGNVFTISIVGDVNKTYIRTMTLHFVTKNGGYGWKLVMDSSFIWTPEQATYNSYTAVKWTAIKVTNYNSSYIKIDKIEEWWGN